jgi:hypothetical protein
LLSGDSRFSFLDVNHPYFSYYQHKVSVYEKLEGPAVASAVPSVGSTSGRMEVDDSSQDMNVTAAAAGEDSHDSSDKSSDGSTHENCKQKPKPGKPLDIVMVNTPASYSGGPGLNSRPWTYGYPE